MKLSIEQRRNQFRIQMITEDSEVLAVESLVSNSGYACTVYTSIMQFDERMRQDPPHVLIVDIAAASENVPLMRQFEVWAKQLPETKILLVVDDVDTGVTYQNNVYDYLLRPLLRPETMLKAVDRACEAVFTQFKIEQLVGRLKKVGAEESFSAREERDIVNLSSLPILDPNAEAAFVVELSEALSQTEKIRDCIEVFLELCSEKIEKLPMLFFKYIPQPHSLVVSLAAGTGADAVGVGFKVSEAQHSLEDLLANSEVKTQLDQVMRDGFGCVNYNSFGVNLENGGMGLIVTLGDFKTTQGRDLFSAMWHLLELNISLKSARFELHGLRRTEPTTGLLNQETFLSLAQDEIQRARRIRKPVSLLAISLDDFAIYRRRAGEALANKVLAAVADVLRRTSRANDISADFGGGDFYLLLPHTPQDGAAIKAEKLRKIIESARFPRAELLGTKRISLSIGVSEYPSSSTGQSNLLTNADDALFFIRKQGGNQVCVASVDEGFKPDFELTP